MIKGIVRSRAARIAIRIRGTSSKPRRIEAVIDTGFNGWLTLPAADVDALGLQWKSVSQGTLADGSQQLFEVFEANILWDGRLRRIPVHRSDSAALVGMALLNGHELTMQIRSRGKVTITRLGD